MEVSNLGFKQAILALLVFCLSLAPLATVVYANPITPPVAVEETPVEAPEPWLDNIRLPARREGLDISGLVPILLPAFGEAYYQVNTQIQDVIDTLITDARRARARGIAFEYEVFETATVVSIVVEAYVRSAISRTLVRSINFCPDTGDILTIREAVDTDIIPLANLILSERMRRAPAYFYALPSLSLETQAFYVCEYGVTILFDEFQLSAMVRGVVRLELLNSRVLHATVSQNYVWHTGNGYNLIMIPLRYAAEQLGYDVRWNARDSSAEVWRDLGQGLQLLIWMTPNINEYRTPTMVRSLEAAPYFFISTNTPYVPITFFEQMLLFLVYDIEEDGNYVFMAYVE